MNPEQLRAAKKIAYVFTGRSSRCAFQAGVIERLPALGIQPAMTIGVSAGSWNAAIVAARNEQRIRYYWRCFSRMRHLDLRNLLVELSPWRYARVHRRTFDRFIGERLRAPEALPCYISVTRLRDLASRNNTPYEFAFEHGCDAVVLVALKGEAEGGIYKNTDDPDHEIPAPYRERVVAIRPRHRLPYSFTEFRWEKLAEMMMLGDLRAREVLLGEIASAVRRHPRPRRLAYDAAAASLETRARISGRSSSPGRASAAVSQ